MNLSAGISLLTVMIGIFGFPEVIRAISSKKTEMVTNSKYSIKEGLSILGRNWFNILRSGLLGMSMGAIPGVGEDTGGWISYYCRDCAKKETWHDIKAYGIKTEYFKKWLHSNPHFNMYKDIFNQDFTRVSGDWFVRLGTYSNGKETFRKIDCHELIEGMF